ncbi:hypothetical protein ACH4TV_33845 [Streptomyces sp. NPDC020898]|uniref:hypothetical protein n=1 Tax=Streptomyces sp. NPDC020898 TaxID=3365101 RepID=UPI003796541E
MKSLIGAAAAASIAAVMGWVPNPWEGEPKVDLSISKTEALDMDVEHVERSSATGEKTGKYPLETAAASVTLHNDGELSAVIVEVRATFEEVRKISPCKPIGGDLAITGKYSYGVPSSVSTGSTQTLPAQFEVKPRSGDTLAITFGPEDPIIHASPLWLYRVKLELRETHSENFFPVDGEFSMASMPHTAWAFSDDACMRKMGDTVVNKFMAGKNEGGHVVSPSLRELHSKSRERSGQ